MAEATTAPAAPAGNAPPPTALTPGAPPPAPAAAAPVVPAAPVDPKAAAPVTPAAPAEIELKLPDGVKFDDATLKTLKDAAKDLGLDGEKASKVAALVANGQKSLREQALKSHEAQVAGWDKALATDKEFGGADFEVNKVLALKAIEKFATPELRKFLGESGLGSHPELVRVFVRVGKAIAEDSVTGTRSATGKASDDSALLRQIYDHPSSAPTLPKE